MLTRRGFLTAAAGVPAWAAAPRLLWGAARDAGPGDRVLVVIELRGGNDGLNTLVPYEDDDYYVQRPNLGVAKQRVHRLDDLNGLHPSLPAMKKWFDEGHLTILRDVGYADQNLSHFVSQDVWASARTKRNPTAGWIGRCVEGEGDSGIELLALGREVAPLYVRTPRRVPPAVADLAAFRIRGGGRRGEEDARRQVIARLNRVPSERENIRLLQQRFEEARFATAELGRLRHVKPSVDYPKGRIGQDLELAARAIRHRLPVRCFHVLLDGFDTHTKQPEEHSILLRKLDRGLDAFLGDLGEDLDRTLVVTVSEFGRRVAESGVGATAGTDHGAASVMFLAGGGVRGGLIGGQPNIGNPDAYGNLRHQVDFRSVYATVIEEWLGTSAERVLGRRYEKLEGLL